MLPYSYMEIPLITPVNITDRASISIAPGDKVRVTQRVREGGKYRLQVFEGLIIARKHGRENGATFTVRRVSNGIGVEKTFPLYSPNIENIEVVRRAKVRRAKLYFLRDKTEKGIREKLRRTLSVPEKILSPKTQEQKEVIKENPETISSQIVAESEEETPSL